jgi:hypothetical protein
MIISFLDHVKKKETYSREMSYIHFLKQFIGPDPLVFRNKQERENRCPLFNFTEFRENTRTKDQVTFCHGLVLDLDQGLGACATPKELLTTLNVESFIYPSYSFFTDGPKAQKRYRLCFPFSRKLTVPSAEIIKRAVLKELDELLIKPDVHEWNRFFYLPCVPVEDSIFPWTLHEAENILDCQGQMPTLIRDGRSNTLMRELAIARCQQAPYEELLYLGQHFYGDPDQKIGSQLERINKTSYTSSKSKKGDGTVNPEDDDPLLALPDEDREWLLKFCRDHVVVNGSSQLYNIRTGTHFTAEYLDSKYNRKIKKMVMASLPLVNKLVYYPGKLEPIFLLDDIPCANLWINPLSVLYASPDPSEPQAGPLFIELVKRVFQEYWEIAMAWTARTVLTPDQKHPFAFWVISDQSGVGKSTYGNVVSYLANGRSQCVNAVDMLSPYNAYLIAKFIWFDDVPTLRKENTHFFEQYKNLVQGSTLLQINEKYAASKYIYNVASLFACSNHQDSYPGVDRLDRRTCLIHSTTETEQWCLTDAAIAWWKKWDHLGGPVGGSVPSKSFLKGVCYELKKWLDHPIPSRSPSYLTEPKIYPSKKLRQKELVEPIHQPTEAMHNLIMSRHFQNVPKPMELPKSVFNESFFKTSQQFEKQKKPFNRNPVWVFGHEVRRFVQDETVSALLKTQGFRLSNRQLSAILRELGFVQQRIRVSNKQIQIYALDGYSHELQVSVKQTYERLQNLPDWF